MKYFDLDFDFRSSSSDEEDIIQQSIETKAARNHLTVNNVRSIIKNVVSNARVVAAVQSRAEELERRVEDCKERIAEGILAESPDGKRMTRNRSRQLNRSSIPIADLSAVVQSHLPSTFFDSESDAFSNDEDIEYQPNYNEADVSRLSVEGPAHHSINRGFYRAKMNTPPQPVRTLTPNHARQPQPWMSRKGSSRGHCSEIRRSRSLHRIIDRLGRRYLLRGHPSRIYSLLSFHQMHSKILPRAYRTSHGKISWNSSRNP